MSKRRGGLLQIQVCSDGVNRAQSRINQQTPRGPHDINVNSFGRAETYPDETELCRQGDAAKYVFFVESGLIKSVRTQADGRLLITDLAFPGAFVGASPVIIGASYPTTAITVCRCSVMRMSMTVFLDRLRADPAFCWQILQQQCYNHVDHVIRHAQLGCVRARYRFEGLLQKFIGSDNPAPLDIPVRIKLPLKFREIAEIIGVTPEHMSRIIRELERDGIIEVTKGWIDVLVPEKLRSA